MFELTSVLLGVANQMDEIEAQVAVCAMIDNLAHRTGTPAAEIAKQVCEVVSLVNDALGSVPELYGANVTIRKAGEV